HLRVLALTRDAEARKPPYHRDLHALGVPAERGEPVAAAVRALLGRSIPARAQRAAQLLPVPWESQGHATVRAAEDRAALVAGQRGRASADDQGNAATVP